MSYLFQLADSSLTDKGTQHTYLGVYEYLFYKKKQTASAVIEVGIGCFFEKNGGSIKLWHDFFDNATIYGIDILPVERVIESLLNNPRVVLQCESNAYDPNFVLENYTNKNIKADIIIDDGAHTFDSMITFLNLYLPILKDDGILIIEDVQDIRWIEELKNAVPDNLKKYIEVIDLRHIKNRYDDLMFVVNKSKNS
jgi:cephalosporin hydroxylase